jgi:NAD(P)-dependent dehydrogenase (short-subunit alcohol dehydrogenase family)
MSKRVDLDGRTIVVTGAASGMGRTIAQRLARQGCALAICDHDEEGLAETAAGLGEHVLQRKLDVRDRQGVFAFAADVDAWAPAPIGAVFNNAGVTTGQTIAESSPEDDEWVMDINFGGVVNGTRAFLPILMRQNSGVIANTSSIFGIGAFPSQSAYCASKFAVRGFTESLRHELRGTGCSAVSIHPGGVKTNIVRNARWHHDHHGESDHDKMIRRFDALVQTSSEKAAKIIVTGVERGKQRILVGPDAHLYDILVRLFPVKWYDIVAAAEPLVMRD